MKYIPVKSIFASLVLALVNISLYAQTAEEWKRLGNTALDSLNYDNAIIYCNKALALDSLDAETFFILGNAYASGKKDYDKAIDLFKKGIQLKPDYEQIKKDIENKGSNLYYPKLWDRFQHGDSTMTLDEKQHLYYGYVFNKNYSPYASSSDSKKINAILNQEDIAEKDWTELTSLIDSALKVNPFSLRNIYYQMIAYDKLGKPGSADINDKKIRCILDAMNSTGDALTKETAIHVIAVANEYDYMFFNHVSIKSQALVQGGYDLLYLQSNEDGIEEFWFDVNQSLAFLNRKYR